MAASARYLITFNVRHFHDVAQLGIVVLTPGRYHPVLRPGRQRFQHRRTEGGLPLSSERQILLLLTEKGE